jgi:hypothetical protein
MVLAALSLYPGLGRAAGDWPDGPNKSWFERLQRPDNDKNPHRAIDPKSLSCCGVADTVKTKFKVEAGDERYPEDRWYAWLNDQWTPIPPEKIVQDHAPDGQRICSYLLAPFNALCRRKEGFDDARGVITGHVSLANSRACR